MQTFILRIDPRKLKLLELNARFMRHEVFYRLVENIKNDGDLTSAPFVAPWKYYTAEDELQRDADGQVIYEVLSGNHRVMAAAEAGLAEIDVKATNEPLTPDQRRAIQLSHNELVGEDDPATLKMIYQQIDDIAWRMYSGLDDKKLQLLAEVKPGNLAEANLSFQTVSMVFFPSELKAVAETWELARKQVAGSKAAWLAHMDSYDKALDAIEAAAKAHNVSNTATALMVVLEVFSRHLGDLREGFLEPDGEAKIAARKVPIATVLEDGLVPAKTAAALNKVTEQMLSRKEIDKDKRWQAIDKLIEAYTAKA